MRGDTGSRWHGSGRLQERYDYDALGNFAFHNVNRNKLATNLHGQFLFTGRKWFNNLRLHTITVTDWSQRRPSRFLQFDPKQFAASDYNLYCYCHNDPVTKTS